MHKVKLPSGPQVLLLGLALICIVVVLQFIMSSLLPSHLRAPLP